MRKSRFLWSHFFTHPGTWVGLALFIIGIGILLSFMVPAILPAIAPMLLLVAGVATLFALCSLPLYIARYIDRLRVKQEDTTTMDENIEFSSPSLFSTMLGHFGSWITRHPVQAFFVAVGIVAFALTLWLTITFFTGGSTLLMAPVFAAIAAPFVANATIGFTSLPLALAITSGVIFTTAPLFLTNVVKRFLALFGSSSDQPGGQEIGEYPLQENKIKEDPDAAGEYSPNIFYQVTHYSGRRVQNEPQVSHIQEFKIIN